MSDHQLPPPGFVPTEEGMEYTLITTDTEWDEDVKEILRHGSPSPYSWSSTRIKMTGCRDLSKFKVEARYYVAFSDYDPLNPTFEIYYPSWKILSQSLEPVKPVFQTDAGDELYTQPLQPSRIKVATAGFNKGTCYSYPLVFDKTVIDYIPRLSTPSQPIVDGRKGGIPDKPFDDKANPPVYPIDAVCSFVPDDRESVTVKYILKTNYEIPRTGVQQSSEITISQVVTQPTGDFADKLQTFIDRSYFGNNYHHMGLYPPRMEPIYDSSGDLIGQINEPKDIKQLLRRTYPVKNKYTGELKDFPE